MDDARQALGTYYKQEQRLGPFASQIVAAERRLAELQAAIDAADRILEDKEAVIYPRRFPEETSASLDARMNAIRDRQKQIGSKGQVVIRFGAAAQERLSTEERAKLKNLVRLTRLALEGAANTLLDTVKATNQDKMDAKFTAVVGDLNRLLQPWGCETGRNDQATFRGSVRTTTSTREAP